MKPPGATCPAIDRARSAVRRLARLAGPSCADEALRLNEFADDRHHHPVARTAVRGGR